MGQFCVNLQGRNFVVPIAGEAGPRRTFVAYRFVDAPDAAVAGPAALTAFAGRHRLAELPADAADPPRVHVVSVAEAAPEAVARNGPWQDVTWTWRSEDPARQMPLLSDVTAIDIVVSRGLGVSHSTFEIDTAAAPAVPLAAADVPRMLDLWRALPPVDPSSEGRCHTPPFGLRFRAADGFPFRASLCWQCDNIFMTDGTYRFHALFDGRSEGARSLLAMLEAVVGC